MEETLRLPYQMAPECLDFQEICHKILYNQEGNKGATVLEIAEAKALKAINKYSVIRKGEEQNKTIFDAYIILAQSEFIRENRLKL
ncbi:hypothetical protein [Chryseobacterium indoltheticum]|uniref:hypothetical protein n=1 Tax=Chryseobacterium indoltheticum TaxID=254 RepID=UPI003F49551B